MYLALLDFYKVIHQFYRKIVNNQIDALNTDPVDFLIQTDTNRLNSSVLNIGSGEPCTVLEIAHLVQDCCMDYLNFKPVIYRSESSKLEKNEMLDFQMTWFNSSNFIFAGEPRIEIKQLLDFCQVHF